MHLATLTSSLVILLLTISSLRGHCRYDMNLEYLEIMNIEKNFKTTVTQKLKALAEEDRFRITDKEEYFVEVVSRI